MGTGGKSGDLVTRYQSASGVCDKNLCAYDVSGSHAGLSKVDHQASTNHVEWHRDECDPLVALGPFDEKTETCQFDVVETGRGEPYPVMTPKKQEPTV